MRRSPLTGAASRRAVLAIAGLGALASPAVAQTAFPARGITLIQPFPPGGSSDLTARAVAELLSRELGRPVVVDNKPGGGTSIASTFVTQSRPDGYTLLVGSPSLAINPALQPSLTPRNPQRELSPIGTTYRSPYVLVVNAALPAANIAELVALARAQPGTLNFASAGIGSTNHLALELFRSLAGADLVHVPYRGSVASLLDLRAGRVQGYFGGSTEVGPLIREGAIRALGITSVDRLATFPDVPALAESLPGFEVNFWQGLFAPAGTPPEVIATLEAALLRVTRGGELSAKLSAQGVQISPGGADDLRRLLATETEKWGRVIRAANIRLE